MAGAQGFAVYGETDEANNMGEIFRVEDRDAHIKNSSDCLCFVYGAGRNEDGAAAQGLANFSPTIGEPESETKRKGLVAAAGAAAIKGGSAARHCNLKRRSSCLLYSNDARLGTHFFNAS